jgi:hypothetical protein
VGQASRSSGLLHVETSLATVFQSGLKTDGDVMMGGVRGMRRSQVKRRMSQYDGLRRTLLPYLTVFNVLGHNDIVVI